MKNIVADNVDLKKAGRPGRKFSIISYLSDISVLYDDLDLLIRRFGSYSAAIMTIAACFFWCYNCILKISGVRQIQNETGRQKLHYLVNPIGYLQKKERETNTLNLTNEETRRLTKILQE